MKVSDLFETYEDVPEVNVRAMTIRERIKHYEFMKSVYVGLIAKVKNYCRQHAYYQREMPEDHRLYEYRSEAKAVTEKMNPTEQVNFYVVVPNLIYSESDRKRMLKTANKSKIKLGSSHFINATRYIPVTKENEKFRRKMIRYVLKCREWEEGISRCTASVQRIERQRDADIYKRTGVNLRNGRNRTR